MDFHSVLQVASMKQSNVEKKKSSSSKKDKGRGGSSVNSDAIKQFLRKQEEDEKKKAQDEKKKKLELLRLRVEANSQRKNVAKKEAPKEEFQIFDMNDDEEEAKKAFNRQRSEDFDGLKHTDFVKSNDRKARTPNNAALVAKQKLDRIKAQMKGVDVGDRMAEIDRELSDDEKNPKPKVKPETVSSRDGHKSKHRDKDRSKDHKHKESHSSSKHKHKDKHREKDRARSHSSKPVAPKSTPYISKHAVSDSDSDISDISLDEIQPKSKQPGWVSVPKVKPVIEEKPKVKAKPKVFKNSGPAPPSFQELMAMAQQKSHDKVPVEQQLKKERKEKKKAHKESRPLTQEEKDRQARTSSKEYQDWIKYGKRAPAKQPAKPRPAQSLVPHPTKLNTAVHKAPTSKDTSSESKNKSSNSGRNGYSLSSASSGKQSSSYDSVRGDKMRDSPKSNGKRPESSKVKSQSHKRSPSPDVSNDLMEKLRLHQDAMKKQQEEAEKLMKMIEDQKRLKEKLAASRSASSLSKPTLNSSKPSSKSTSSLGSSNGTSSSNKRTKHIMSDDEEEEVPAKKKRPAESKPAAAASANPWDRIYSQIQARNPKPKKKPVEDDFIDDDYEDEYDSELDDFIDDGEDEVDVPGNMNYSKHIRSIFGYDKRKFKNERDGDLRDMESNFTQISREESRSARLGMKEDLEDIKREEEELKRKKKRY